MSIANVNIIESIANEFERVPDIRYFKQSHGQHAIRENPHEVLDDIISDAYEIENTLSDDEHALNEYYAYLTANYQRIQYLIDVVTHTSDQEQEHVAFSTLYQIIVDFISSQPNENLTNLTPVSNVKLLEAIDSAGLADEVIETILEVSGNNM